MINDAEGYREKWRRLASDSAHRDPEAVAAAALRDFTALCRSLPGGEAVTLYTPAGEPVSSADVTCPPMQRTSRSGYRCRAVGRNGKRCRFPATDGRPFCAHHADLTGTLPDLDPAP